MIYIKLTTFLVLITDIFAFQFPNLLPLWYQIGNVKDLKDKPVKIVIDDNALCLFKDKKTKEIKLISDHCSHRGSSLSKGKLCDTGGIICSYHSICFNKSKKTEFSDNLKIVDDNIFFTPSDIVNVEPHYPPEYFNKKFRSISGSYKLNTNIHILLENVIDALHISTVHTFGNKESKPENLRYERLSSTALRQYFDYSAGDLSISKQIQKLNKEKTVLKVENEYHLPGTVLSRVYVNKKDVKTICVNAYPISENECMIHWKLYRNFLIFDLEILNQMVDKLFDFLFLYTLQEDIAILGTVYPKYRLGEFNTKYDKIQLEYRKDIEKMKNIE